MAVVTREHVSRARRALVVVKVAHTVAWAFLGGSVLAIPVAGWLRRFDWGTALSVIIAIEIIVLALNGTRCPLTDVAARYTDERGPNFDIYLPIWLARHNKTIFGVLFVLGEAYFVWRWAH